MRKMVTKTILQKLNNRSYVLEDTFSLPFTYSIVNYIPYFTNFIKSIGLEKIGIKTFKYKIKTLINSILKDRALLLY